MLDQCPLVVCPKAVKTAWREAAKSLGVPLLDVVNVEKLKAGGTPYLKVTKSKQFDKKTKKKVTKTTFVWTLPRGTLVMWDEVQNASGYDSQNGKVLALTRAYGLPTLLMSATAAESPLKMRALGYLLKLHKYQDHYSWCLKHGCGRDRWGGLEFVKSQTVAKRHMMSLHESIFPDKGVRVRIEELDSFPENAIFADAYDMDEHTDAINRVYEELEHKFHDPDNEEAPLTMLLRARQNAELFKTPLMVDMTEDLLEEGKSVVIFINFRDTLEALETKLMQHHPTSIFGGQDTGDSTANRDEAMRKFQADETRVIICMIQAGGVGVNLHDTHGNYPRASLISPNYSAREMKQALGRIHRSKGKTKCIQHLIFAAGTVEEEACNSVRKKLNNIATLNDGDLAEGLI